MQLLRTLRSSRKTILNESTASCEFLVEPLEDRTMLTTISVFARGGTGDEIVNVQVDGRGTLATIGSLPTDDFQEYQFFIDEPVTANDIRIDFVNDFYNPAAGIDRGVIVDRIEIDGNIYQTENAAVFSTGTWTAADGIQSGFGRGDTLHTNGYLQYSNAGFGGVANTTLIEAELEITGTTSRIEVDVLVDDQVVDSWLLPDSFRDNPRVFGYRAQGDISPDRIKLAFTNDVYISNPDGSTAVDNNAQFNSITIDGVNYNPFSENVFSTGTWRPEDGITPGFGRGNALHVNGYFQFFDTAERTEIVIDARGFGDSVDFELQIDEVAVASYSLAAIAGNSQEVFVYDAVGVVDPERVRIAFTNDATFTDPISGATIDRNLQINSVSIGGVVFDPADDNVFSTGTWRPEDGVTPGFGRGDFLHTDGYFAFSSNLPVATEVIYQNNFDQHSAGLYTRDLLNSDWDDPEFNDGVDEGRVTVVSGQNAFGGTGSSLAVAYPEDEVGTKETGAQWQLELDDEYEEAFLSYRVQFAEGFDFSRGGKLPGLAGGSAPTGNAPAEGDNGWTGRLMWLTDFTGQPGEPEQLTSQAISYAKYTDSGFNRDGRDEDEIHWIDPDGSRSEFESGVWYEITQRVVMNTPGVSDGVIQVWLDGELVHDQTDVLFRTVPDLKIDQVYFSTFFGGSDGWETTKDETVFFDDFEVSIPVSTSQAATASFESIPEPSAARLANPTTELTSENVVEVVGSGGRIRLIGDDADNVVNVTVDDAGALVLWSENTLFRSNGETSSSLYMLGDVGELKSLKINLKDGNDTLRLVNSSDGELGAGRLITNLGQGNDRFIAADGEWDGTLKLNTGSGDDVIQLTGVQFAGLSSVRGSAGDDRVDISNSPTQVRLSGGSGFDQMITSIQHTGLAQWFGFESELEIEEPERY